MKYFSNKSFNLLLVGLMTGLVCAAQNFDEKTSIGDQLKMNTAPGMKYAPASIATKQNNGTPETKPVGRELELISLKEQIRQGKLGMPVTTTATTSANTVSVTDPNRPALTSDQSSEQSKVLIEKNKPVIKPIILPSQDEAVQPTVEKKKEQ